MLDRPLVKAQKAFRRVAMYAYAFNQSHAKVLMDPLYNAVSAILLRDDVPLSKKLVETKYDPNLFFAYRAQSRRLHYYIDDWDFSEARPELLTPRQRQMMHTIALGETSGAAVGDGFLRAFRTEPELAAFFGTWFVEELNHFIGYHAYIERMGERWPVQRGLDVANVEFIPYAKDPYEVAACNMYQELLGFLVYRSFGRQAKDPFLAKMLTQFAKDELRHYKFYQGVVARRIQQDPSFRRVVLKTILKATSPYNQVSGSASNVLDHMAMGAFYFRKPEYEYFLNQVEFLLGTPLKGFFDWYFDGVVDNCKACGKTPVQCDCVQFEDELPPATRNPDWWKAKSHEETRLDGSAWTADLFAHAARARRADQESGARGHVDPAPTSPTN